MPKTTFSTDNVRQSATSFPKLKLDHGQVVRLVCIEPGPTFEWVHQVQKPRISPVNGKPVMVTRNRKNGEQYQDYDMEFVGSPICHGDPDVLEEKGVDVARCPLCALSTKDEAFRGPQRRFAIHVLKYATKTGTGNITEPFSVETLVWVLSDTRFAALASIFAEHAEDNDGVPDPRKIDLILGPCTNAGFQQYEIKAGARCEMLSSEDRVKRALATYQENHAPDLTPYCGRPTERRWLDQMVEEVQDRYAQIRQGNTTATPVDVTATLDSSLLDNAPASTVSATREKFEPPPADAPPGEGSPLNEFKPGGSLQDVPASTDEPPWEEPPAKPKGEEVSFEDLLAQLSASGGAK